MLPERNIRVARGNLARLGNTLGTLGTLARVEAANLAARIQGTVPRGHYMEDLAEYLEVLPGTSSRDFDTVLEVMGINPHHVLAQFPTHVEGDIDGDVIVIEVVNGDLACGVLRLRERMCMADLAKALLGTELPAHNQKETASTTPVTVAPATIALSTANTGNKPTPASALRAPTMPAVPHRFPRTSPPAPLHGKATAVRKPPPADESPSRVSIPFPSTAREKTRP